MVQWLTSPSNAGGVVDSASGWGVEIHVPEGPKNRKPKTPIWQQIQ